MSDLQIVLIIIGALIILAVVLINWWQERRFHQQVERSFSPLQSDALLDDPKLDSANFSQELATNFNDGNYSLSDHDSLENQDFEEPNLSNKPKISDEPSLSYDGYDKAEIDQFAIEDYAPDEVLEEHYDALPDYIKDPDEFANDLSSVDLETAKRSPQHEDIKAIFEEAFNDKKTSAANVEPFNHENQTVADSSHLTTSDESPNLPAMLHAQMDLTALLYLAEETPLGKFIEALVGLFDDYDKPVFLHVLDSNKEWHLLKDASSNLMITRVACTLQLADRGGPVSRNTLNRFQLAAETIGLDINAHVEWQSNGDALTVANALDAFCIEVDKTIGFHLVHGESGAFTGTKLRGLAESQGLTLDNGVFKFIEDAQSAHPHASFIMFNRENFPFSPDMLRNSVVKGVTFQMDIPHVKHCAEAFNTMVQVARQMEIGLNAVLVDDNNKVLGEIQIEKIRQQLKVIHATMLVRGIVPGSESAHRLFA